MVETTNSNVKPHIEYIPTVRVWACTSGEAPGGILMGVGDTPLDAYLDWVTKRVFEKWEEEIPSMDLGLTHSELLDLYE